MNLNVKKLSLLLVGLDILVISKSLPIHIIFYSIISVMLSFVFIRPWLRNTIKIILLITGIFLIKFVFKMFLVTEAGVSFVLMLATLKLWELDTENDHFNMFLILALLESALFLIEPNFFMFAMGFFKILFYFYFILKIRNYDLSLLSWKRMVLLIVPSMLLSVLMFYTFPRFTQGFLNSSNNSFLFSGNNNNINFSELGKLNLSSSIVFRAFGLNPEQFPITKIYWRTNILWDYSQNTWRTSYHNLKGEPPPLIGPRINYHILLSQESNDFLPTLDGSTLMLKSSQDYNYYVEGSYKLKTPSRLKVEYDLTTTPTQALSEFSPLVEKKSLRLRSPYKEQFSKLILAESGAQTPEEKLKLVEDFFRSRHFEYSLSPKSYKSLEEFILNGKEGYCSHFAAAFTYLARTVGLPARIVSGYQGGEYNPFDQSIIVRELDAHSWSEIYLPAQGWVKVDPTEMVAPARLALGSKSFHDKLEPYISFYYFQFPKKFFDLAFVSKTSLYFDSVNSSLSSQIFNFDQVEQGKVLAQFYPKKFAAGWIFVIVLMLFLALVPILFYLSSRKKLSKEELRYRLFLKKMKGLGVEKKAYETAFQFSSRCIQELPHLKHFVDEEVSAYQNHFYS